MSDYQQKLKTLKNEFTSLQRQYESAQSGSNMGKTRNILKKMEKTVKRLEQAKKREQKRKTRKATIDRRTSRRKAERAKTRKARKTARAKREQKVVLNVSPGKTLEDYLRISPHFKRPTPTALERARELTFGQGVEVSQDMLNRLAQIQEQKRQGNQKNRERTLSDIELDELEREYETEQARKAADEYLAFINQQPSPTDNEMKLMMNELYGGKRRRKSRKSKKSRKLRKSKKSIKSKKKKKSRHRRRR